MIIFIFKGIKHHKAFQRLLNLIMLIIFIGTYYLGTAGVCYGRSPLPRKELKDEEISSTLVEDALSYYMNEYNTIAQSIQRDSKGQPILPYSIKELSQIINTEYENNTYIDGYANQYSPTCKRLVSSPLFSQMQITGISMSITGEANVNGETPKGEIAFTIAHEIAHIRGIYREDDANMAALIVCYNSSNIYLKYSALYISISSLIEAYEITYRTSYANKYHYNFWKTHNLLQDITDKWNTFYLKINGSKKGTGDYVDSTSKVDTGEKDETGNTIYQILSYSPYQKYLYYLFVNK